MKFKTQRECIFHWARQRQTEFTREKFFCPYDDDDDVSWGGSSFCSKLIILWWICESCYFWSRKHFNQHVIKCFAGFSNLLQQNAFKKCFEVKGTSRIPIYILEWIRNKIIKSCMINIGYLLTYLFVANVRWCKISFSDLKYSNKIFVLYIEIWFMSLILSSKCLFNELKSNIAFHLRI